MLLKKEQCLTEVSQILCIPVMPELCGKVAFGELP